MQSRADVIEAILRQNGGQLTAPQIADHLCECDGHRHVYPQLIRATIRQDNLARKQRGEAPRFSSINIGSQKHGTIILRSHAPAIPMEPLLDAYQDQIPLIIQAANGRVEGLLKRAISRLTWKAFESRFLEQILAALGFLDVVITRPSRDGGKDALCRYRRGIVESKAIVSAKHWKTENVGPDEVQRLRGIKGHEDTGVIVTSAKFTPAAKEEAKPSQNQRSIALVDGDLIVRTCLETGIGVKAIPVPVLYLFTDLSLGSTLASEL